MNPHPSSREFFESRYRQSDDPWSFATSAYELFRYERILAALDGKHYSSAFEPGCSVGVLTAKLAPLCDSLLATDLSTTAIAHARERCRPFPNVAFSTAGLQQVEPSAWDLLVLSEIGYYFSPDDWQILSTRLLDALPSGATVLAAHWLGHSPDHQMHGNDVHAVLAHQQSLHHTHAECHQNFRLDLWCKS